MWKDLLGGAGAVLLLAGSAVAAPIISKARERIR